MHLDSFFTIGVIGQYSKASKDSTNTPTPCTVKVPFKKSTCSEKEKGPCALGHP